ncbi:MAG: hypothetical protein R6V49_05945 [Bacteroidales bacterium]
MSGNLIRVFMVSLLLAVSMTLCGQAWMWKHHQDPLFQVQNPQATVNPEPILQPVFCPVHAGFSIAQYPICAGCTVQLINASWNATDYEWFLNGVSFSTLEHPAVQLDKPGNNEIMLISSSIICSDTAKLLLQVFDTYSLQVYDTICHGDVYWFLQTPCQVTGTYSFQLLTQKGCDSLITLHLYVEPADASFVLSGDSAVAMSPGQWYQWCECSSVLKPVPGATNQVFKPSLPGFYTLIARTEVCSDTAECQYFTMTGMDVPASLKSLKAYPVPAKEKLSIQGIPESEHYTAEICALSGKILLTASVDYYSPSLDIRQLPAGPYLLRLTDRDRNLVNILFLVQRN